ncbi:hypothetical protein I4U23_008530 [Adineta vaga]|nr:hypothetical protein I4U23_008530 [Adineta vaga]
MAFLGKANNLLIRRPSALVYKYIKQLSSDYRDALIDTGKKMIQRPIKTIFYSTNISLLIYAYRTMPSFQSYQNDLVNFRHQELLTSSLIRNRQVETYIDTIEQLLLRDQIHFVDCYLFSLIIYRNQHRTNDFSHRFYENICSYLNLKRNARIIDIGICNRWFQLSRQLRRADIFDEMNNEKVAL